MRVLQITPFYYPELKFGGPPQKIHSLSQGLIQRGYKVRVITLNSEDPSASDAKNIDGVEVQYVPWIGKGSLKIHGGFGKLFSAVKWADLIHCYGLYNLLCPVAALFANRLGKPYLLEPLGMYVPRIRNLPAKTLYHKLFTRPMARRAAAVIATSIVEAQELSDLVSPEHLVVRPNGIGLEQFQNLPEKTIFRARFGIAASERLILYIGRISPVKNLENLILAFQSAKLTNARLILVGPMLEPQYTAQIQSLILEKELDSKILLVGPLYGKDKLAALSSADLFVLPSISESFGNAAAEAIAAGIPVLVTEGCGIASIVRPRTGLVVQPDVGSLTIGLKALISETELRDDFVKYREQVLKDLSWDVPLKQTETLYVKIADTYKTNLVR